ncbi:SDR family oxidoreductase [Xanthomonas campestris pv. incanae]|uniref:SDR family oxidoreductase n=1 Tax=Xanthomonas campestris TaxID=339 RepID=UPI00177ACA4F|nr:SDR family oxidoreductase [Xanthomonas campestris]MDX6083882.1 SDR family oxidoreductase [Xanthomonas campestris pv. incanae]MDX6141533.1 SDR family oxidoreductase [Xanthomonas campestris pv. incanae]MEB1626286.1 SDR family oxidoreductase [Xanthomonas campestris pv. campestris]QOF04894.1 SDR family oxidoreductase [Xanthomonas campestris]
MNFSNKTAVVTGGTTGIGFATATLLLEQGARVTITGQNQERLAAAANALAAYGDRVSIALVEMRRLNDLASLRAQVQEQYGHLDILFANAGVAFVSPLDTTTEARFDEMFDVNVKSVFFTVQHLAPLMQPGSSIVMNTSWLAETGTAGLSLLSASKAAVRSMTRTLAAELMSRGVRVNAVSPGPIATPIHGKIGMKPDELAQFAANIQQEVPIGRFGEAEEVAAAVVFLAGSGSGYMRGSEVVVDGGYSQL